MPERAVVYLHAGPTEDRQERAISAYCDQHNLLVTARTIDVDACAQLVADHLAEVVVAATDPRNGLTHKVTIAGGRVEFARQKTRQPTLADWLRRAIGRGVSPHQIASAVGEETIEISRIMRELGIERPDGRQN